MKKLLCVVVPLLVLLTAGPAFCAQAAPAAMSSGSDAATDAGPDGTCSTFAVCQDGSSVYCTGSTICRFRDADCEVGRGYVVCDGIYTWCPPCPECSLDGAPCSDNADCQSGPEPACQYCVCNTQVPNLLDPEAPKPADFCVCP